MPFHLGKKMCRLQIWHFNTDIPDSCVPSHHHSSSEMSKSLSKPSGPQKHSVIGHSKALNSAFAIRKICLAQDWGEATLRRERGWRWKWMGGVARSVVSQYPKALWGRWRGNHMKTRHATAVNGIGVICGRGESKWQPRKWLLIVIVAWMTHKRSC